MCVDVKIRMHQLTKMNIRLHLGLSQKDIDVIKNGEEKRLTKEILLGYMTSFDEDLDDTSEDYLLDLIKMACLSGFYEGISSLEKVSIEANYDADYVYGE